LATVRLYDLVLYVLNYYVVLPRRAELCFVLHFYRATHCMKHDMCYNDSVCLPATLVHCVETAEQIEQIFGMEAIPSQCYVVL